MLKLLSLAAWLGDVVDRFASWTWIHPLWGGLLAFDVVRAAVTGSWGRLDTFVFGGSAMGFVWSLLFRRAVE